MKKLLLSLAVVLAAAGVGVGDDDEKDLKKLTGTWEEVSHVADGKAMAADELKGTTGRRASSVREETRISETE
jgi:hypothetical protein